MIDVKNSKFLIGAVLISILMQLVILYTPLNVAFKTVPIGVFDWVKIILMSSTLYIILEARKMIINRIESKKTSN
jgi:Ca2+-transporting ATPase